MAVYFADFIKTKFFFDNEWKLGTKKLNWSNLLKTGMGAKSTGYVNIREQK